MKRFFVLLLVLCCGCSSIGTGLTRHDIIERYGNPEMTHKSPTHEGMVELLIYDKGETIVTVKNGVVSHIMR